MTPGDGEPSETCDFVAYVRAAAEHRNVKVGVVARELAALATTMD